MPRLWLMAVTDEAMLRIREMIVAGELSPGDRLPPEKELSERLGLSRNSLREAVKALEVMRVLDVRRGDGTYVTSLSPAQLLEAISFVADMHRDDSLLEILAVRRVLESWAAGVAASTPDRNHVAVLHGMVDDARRLDTIEQLVDHDLAFHREIVRVTGNAYLLGLIDGLSSGTVKLRIWRGLTEENAVNRTINEHAAIADAIARGDSGLAEALTTAHIGGVETWLRGAIAQQ